MNKNMPYDDGELKDFLSECVELPEMGYCSWDWGLFFSYYHPQSGKFYWGQSSGCSCDYFWQDFTVISDFCVGSKNEYIRAASAYAGGNGNIDSIRNAIANLKK